MASSDQTQRDTSRGMNRLTARITKQQEAKLDALIAIGECTNQSDALRTAIDLAELPATPDEFTTVDELRDSWRVEFERALNTFEHRQAVRVEWDTSSDEAILRLTERERGADHVSRGGRTMRPISAVFNRAVDAAHNLGRLASAQDNPEGGEFPRSGMLAIPVADNFSDGGEA